VSDMVADQYLDLPYPPFPKEVCYFSISTVTDFFCWCPDNIPLDCGDATFNDDFLYSL
jgi:hypothetical protein